MVAAKSIRWLKAHTEEGVGFFLKTLMQAILVANLIVGAAVGEFAIIYYLCTGHF